MACQCGTRLGAPRFTAPQLISLSAPSVDSLSLFLPTIIAQLGFANWRSQLMTVPVYFMALVGILFFVWFSHKTNQRGTAIAVGGAIAIIGYIILLTTHTPGARYAGTFFAVIGIYASNGERRVFAFLRICIADRLLARSYTALLLAWPSENVSPQTKRAVASGMQIFVRPGSPSLGPVRCEAHTPKARL